MFRATWVIQLSSNLYVVGGLQNFGEGGEKDVYKFDNAAQEMGEDWPTGCFELPQVLCCPAF